MSTALDARFPAIVVVGRWNDGILNEPAWVAEHVLALPKDQDIEVRQIIFGNDVGSVRKIWLFDKIGICCQNGRLEIFSAPGGNNGDIYTCLRRLAELLPHTPVSAIGFNFHFRSEEDVAALSGKLSTDEDLDGVGGVFSQTRSDYFVIDRKDQIGPGDATIADCKLKLERSTDFNVFDIDFNFHYDVAKVTSLRYFADHAALDHWRDFSIRVLQDTFGLTDVDYQYF